MWSGWMWLWIYKQVPFKKPHRIKTCGFWWYPVQILPKSLSNSSCFYNASQKKSSILIWLYILVVNPDIENQISQLMIKTEGGWQCGQVECDYVSNQKCNLRNHIESKHVDIGGIQCNYCPKVCPTNHAFSMHLKRNHPFKWFSE